MCGIAGYVNWSGAPATIAAVVGMTDRLVHRGPDGEGHHVFENAAIGHRRLSIIDVNTGAQPMANEDRSTWVTFNGEIYNFAELRATLKSHGHSFATASDTEVLVHGYEQWGDDVVLHLRGIFAFAILDQPRRRLLLARDHFGVKPLVFHFDEERFAFASEMKAITGGLGVEKRLDETSIADYFDYGYVPAPKTILQKFHKLEPGHTLAVDLRRPSAVTPRRYWRLNYEPRPVESEERILNQLDAMLDESVRLQLVSDVPLGAMLSGGIDSSAVVSMMARHSADQIETFTIGFENERFSEASFARQVAIHLGTAHHEHTVHADVTALLPRLVYHFDEPFADASAVPTYYVCEMARQSVTVCLSGDGGDEMFAGYDRYVRSARQGMLDAVPLGIRRLSFGLLSRLLPRHWPGAALLHGVSLTPQERFVEQLRAQYGEVDGRSLLSNRGGTRVAEHRRSMDYLSGAFDPRIADDLHGWLNVDVNTYLPNDILAKVDITSMMNSLEVRVPLLDHRLAEFVATLPANFKLRNGVAKYALKQLFRQRLPAHILDRPKMGFGVPMREWLATELRDLTRHYLLESPRASGVLDQSLIRRMIDDNERLLYGSRTSGKLWWALWFEMWYQDVFSAS